MDDRYLRTAEDFSSISPSRETNHKPVIDKEFLHDVLTGLSRPQKTLPCKYFYDENGSRLFEQICNLDEYYVTRTELSLLDNIKQELSKIIGTNAVIIEPGAGAGIKIQKLLSSSIQPEVYVPLDISKDFLFYSAQVIQNKFPNLDVQPIQGDFTQPIKWLEKNNSNRIVFFPGSTIGNFEAKQAIDFLVNMKNLVGNQGAIIIGVDQIKNRETLINAYDDSLGITAEFNKNILTRINKELNGNLKLPNFEHKAIFNESLSRIEMHLVSSIEQSVLVNGRFFSFTEGESIHTENSHKYSDESFLNLAASAGLKPVKSWSDKNGYFRIYYLTNE